MGEFTSAPQVGKPGHCFNAQVFGPDGSSVATLDATDDPAQATDRAVIIAAALNDARRTILLGPTKRPDGKTIAAAPQPPDDWAPYLKECETTLERLQREIADNHALLGLLAKARATASQAQAPQPARKIGGSYQADGAIVARFKTRAGDERVVFEFDTPRGMLHIFNTDQVRNRHEHCQKGSDDHIPESA